MDAPPRATYRLQFSKDFRFADAEAIVPYLAALGISHIYASPLMMARPGSLHGYDIVDHNRLNPEYGEPGEFDSLIAALRRHGMGLILDFVPNHMGIGADNPWWMDVLEWGQASPYAAYFDIDWTPQERSNAGKVLLPVLGDHYGAVLERGELALHLDPEIGRFTIAYFDRVFPIAPRDYPRLLERAASRTPLAQAELTPLAQAFRESLKGPADVHRTARRHRIAALKEQLAALLRDDRVRAACDDVVSFLNGIQGEPASYDALHGLLERQAYRLAFWRVAVDEINYRRFFDINDLAGLRMDRPDLFEVSHRLVHRLIAEGKVDGLRLDHVDGLRLPREYFDRLQRLVAPGWRRSRLVRRKAEGHEALPLFVLVEKILAPHESLRRDWPVAGTTGYDFMAAVNGVFVDPRSERALTRLYRTATGYRLDFAETVRMTKRLVMREILAAEHSVLANVFYRLAKQSRRTRDYTRIGFREALEDVIACFPVYRSYVDGHETSAQDRRDIDWAIGQARKHARRPDTSIYDFIRDVLTLDLVKSGAHRRQSVVDAALRFQQYTGPVMAKAAEDTGFYRYLRFVSLNEVGGDPAHFGTSPESFHDANRERGRHHPHAMLATATHDHKRGEDVRARLNVVSEIPMEWTARIRRWARFNARKKDEVDGARAPGGNEEYLFYQTVVGTWPFALRPPGYDGLTAFRDRVAEYMLKAAREAKGHTSWAAPDEAYETALRQFVERTLNADYHRPFLDDVFAFVERIAPAGAINGLAQTLLKLTAPGFPDIYQGTERWDLSLVDPDNRRRVDFAALDADIDKDRALSERLASWRDGGIKQALIQSVLAARRDHPALFAAGTYVPLAATGRFAEHLFAFARIGGDDAAVVAVPRLIAGMASDARAADANGLAVGGWEDTELVLDAALAQHRFSDMMSGRSIAPAPGGLLSAGSLFAAVPVVFLIAARL